MEWYLIPAKPKSNAAASLFLGNKNSQTEEQISGKSLPITGFVLKYSGFGLLVAVAFYLTKTTVTTMLWEHRS
jgi:hypothetical protein